jgi:hypothetical protein
VAVAGILAATLGYSQWHLRVATIFQALVIKARFYLFLQIAADGVAFKPLSSLPSIHLNLKRKIRDTCNSIRLNRSQHGITHSGKGPMRFVYNVFCSCKTLLCKLFAWISA